MATRGRAAPALEHFTLGSGLGSKGEMQPGLGLGTSPVRVARVLCPLPGRLSEGEIFLEHLKGDAVALRGPFQLCFQGR